MNWKTTLVLFVLAALGALAWYWLGTRESPPAVNATTAFLENELKADKLTAIEIRHGRRRVRLTRRPGQEWSLPAGWPIRTIELNHFLQSLTQLRSRYTPIPIEEPDLAAYGMARDPLQVIVDLDGKQYTLTFGEMPDDQNRFSRATFVRLDQQREVVRLGPGVIAALDRSQEYFQKPRLFAFRAVPERKDSATKVEQVEASEIRVQSPEGGYTLRRAAPPAEGESIVDASQHWELTAPFRDRLDADKVKSILSALPDLWAEQYIDGKTLQPVRDKLEKYVLALYASNVSEAAGNALAVLPYLGPVARSEVPAGHLAVLGLLTPEQVLTVHGPAGPVTLLIGKSDARERTVTKPAPFPGAPPIPVQTPGEVRYARLEGNPQIFEIRPDKLKDVLVSVKSLRDTRLARFDSSDVRRLEIRQGKLELIFVKQVDDKDHWRMLKPEPAAADAEPINELLRKLSSIDVKESDIIEPDKAQPAKEYGLDNPSVLLIEVEEGKKDDGKKEDGKKDEQPPTIKKFAFRLGTKAADKDKNKLYVQVDDVPRINVLDDSLSKLASRPALEYRSLRLWDMPAAEIAEVRIKKGDTLYALKRDGATWRITGPFEAVAVPDKAQSIVHDLVEPKRQKYIAPEAGDLKSYGLDAPALQITVVAKDTEKDAKNKTYTLEIGKPVEKEAKSRYARLADDKAVFTIDDKLMQAVDHTALDLLDRALLRLDPKAVTEVRSDGAFTLKRDKSAWQVLETPAKPFTPDEEALQQTLRAWSNLKALRFAAYGPKVSWAEYGLDKPVTTIRASADGKEHTLALGKEVPDNPGQRFARLDKQEGVAVLDAATVRDLQRTYVDFVDRQVLKFDLDAVTAIQRTMGKDELEIVKKDDAWHLVKPAAHVADAATIDSILEMTFRLRAKRIAAYPAKDLKPFGLDPPEAIVTLRLGNDLSKQHVLKVGKPAVEPGQKESGERYAIIADSATVMVLADDLARQLVASPLQFRDRNLANFSEADKVALERGDRRATFAKVDGRWKMTDPVKADAEEADLEEFLRGIQRLRADELVAEKAADRKPFGLDPPLARWRISSGDKEVLHFLIGKEKDGRGYAQLAGGELVFLLNPKQTTQALAEYRSRKVWAPLDAVQVEQVTFDLAGKKSFTLQKSQNGWRALGQEVKVSDKAVSDTLDALADLRAARFAADQKTSLQLYGLAPTPVLAVKLQTASGERVLHVGRQEGPSERHYATVPGSDNAPVFVISEGDARRIVRDLPAFTEDAKMDTKKNGSWKPEQN